MSLPLPHDDFAMSTSAPEAAAGPREADLSSAFAGPRERQVALAVVLLSACAFVAAVPFARVALPPVPAFIPSYEAALAINDLITALLLFGQLAQQRSRALLALACGYLFDALIIIPHALTFPGLFTPSGLLGAGSQTTAWLYMFWHGGFPIFVIAYAVLRESGASADPATRRDRRATLGAIAATIVVVVAATLLATAGHEMLPGIMAGNHYTPVMAVVVSAVWLLSLGALLLLCRRRSPSVLDLWLRVVMCAWLFDIALSAVLNAGRFDLGFYAGRGYGLLAASFVLAVLLLETNRLHDRLAAARVGLETYARELEGRVRARTAELAQSNATLTAEIAERRQAEQELLRTRAFLNVIIESIPATLVVKEASGRRYVLVNRAAEELLGCSRSEIVGRTVHDLFPAAEADEMDADDLRVLSSGIPREATEQTVTTRKQGARLVRTRIVPVLGEDGRPKFVLGIGEDVTQRRQTEAQLHHAQKMEAIGNLTGGMAHDFNNTLAAVVGNLDLLRGLTRGNASIDELVVEALDAALRGAELTRQLLAFARRQPLKPTRIDVNKLIEDTSKLLARTLGEEIAIAVKLAPDLWPVVADAAQLESAVTNLATNARDAMPNGGRLTIGSSNRRLDEDYASLHPEVLPGDFAMIEVSDSGTGIPPEVASRIFEPFFTTKGAGKGTGLGLSMVFGFIKQSGGHVSVYSEPGHGTTFRLYLPRAREDISAVAQPIEAESPRGHGETILVVEDNVALRRLAIRQVRELGYRVQEAGSAAAALEILERERVDLLFTDIVMPGECSGLELARIAVERWPHIGVVLTSGFPGTRSDASLGATTMAELLSKPYRKADLARALHDALAKRPS
jgi:PAS domain S-box-containing protein